MQMSCKHWCSLRTLDAGARVREHNSSAECRTADQNHARKKHRVPFPIEYIYFVRCDACSGRVRTANVSADEIDFSRSRFSDASSGCARMHVSRQCRHLLPTIMQ